MRPAFLGVNIARSALFASQQQLDITSHNIANASVEGYSRQRLSLTAAPDIYQLGGGYPGAVGEGVWAEQVQRLRDGLLDRDFRRQNEELQAADAQKAYLDRLEGLLGELGDTGLQAQVEKFFDAWQDLSHRPEDMSLRKVMLAEAETLTGMIREFDAEALNLQQNAQDELTATVDRVNAISSRLAALNPEIVKRAGLGETPADLLDERDRLLDELSDYARIDVQEDQYGAVQVRVDGKALVVDDVAHEIRMLPSNDIQRGSLPIGFPNTLNAGDLVINGVDIIGGGPSLTIASAADYGSLLDRINAQSAATGIRASVDPAGQLVLEGLRDGSTYLSLELSGVGVAATGHASGETTLTSRVQLQLRTGTYLSGSNLGGKLEGLSTVRNQDFPATMSGLHSLTADLIRRVNTVHESAYNLRRTTGQPFFTGTNPGDIQVAAGLIADPSRVATAATANFPPGDGSQALAIYALRKDMGFDARYQSLVTGLGTRIAQVTETGVQRSLVLEQLENQRQSVAGVNLDEELSNMLQFQRSFNAAARVMNTLDEMLAQVVNGLGAGR